MEVGGEFKGRDRSVRRRASGKNKLPWLDVVPVEDEGVEEFKLGG